MDDGRWRGAPVLHLASAFGTETRARRRAGDLSAIQSAGAGLYPAAPWLCSPAALVPNRAERGGPGRACSHPVPGHARGRTGRCGGQCPGACRLWSARDPCAGRNDRDRSRARPACCRPGAGAGGWPRDTQELGTRLPPAAAHPSAAPAAGHAAGAGQYRYAAHALHGCAAHLSGGSRAAGHHAGWPGRQHPAGHPGSAQPSGSRSGWAVDPAGGH